MVMVMEGGEVCWGEFRKSKIADGFANGATTSSPMGKRTPQLDSARQIGLGSTSHDFSDCSGGDVSRGNEM